MSFSRLGDCGRGRSYIVILGIAWKLTSIGGAPKITGCQDADIGNGVVVDDQCAIVDFQPFFNGPEAAPCIILTAEVHIA